MTVTLFVVIFLACAVEATEALTIVLAAGVSHGFRTALNGAATALVLMAIVAGALTPLFRLIPLTPLRIVAGAIMLYYGVTWLRKGILRATGRKALHNESQIFQTLTASSPSQESGFTLAFMGVFMEGVEIILLVVALAAGQPLGYLAAGLAILLVGLVGVVVRHPLSRVPENSIKLMVGVMLTGIGVFWLGEGLGVQWPLADASLFVIYAVLASGTFATVRVAA